MAAEAVRPQDENAVAVRRRHTSSPPTARQSFSIAPHNVFLFLVGFRVVNALTTRTFFQPDEYFQALEPAWQWAFGEGAGAWITWEWKNHLRSAIHPAIFGLCYQLADSVAEHLMLQNPMRSEVLLAAPKTLQAIFAATADFYTWRLASSVYGDGSTASLATLLLTVVSPWQWFCSTRTFSNSLETTLTIIALYNWPWNRTLPHDGNDDALKTKQEKKRILTQDNSTTEKASADEVTRLRRALLCAAVATILRPTNILIWMILTFLTFVRDWNSIGLNWVECIVFFRETVLCGGIILLSSAILDRICYDAWVFPPLNFLRINVVQSLATFYGNNDWHYYVSQGYPLLLTTALPFTMIGLFRVLSSSKDPSFAQTPPAGRNALYSLSITCLLVPAAFSVIAHKEVRFIYPLLPALHTLTALPLASFFHPLTSRSPSLHLAKRLLLFLILSLNFTISFYTTQIHNSGIIGLTDYLRHEFEMVYLDSPMPLSMTVGMLMPCHSTPWRSHLQYPPSSTHPGIRAWALTCEPPLNLNATEKSSYLDEADQFYANPSIWIKKHMSRYPPHHKGNTQPAGSVSGIFAAHSQHGKIDTIPRDILESERAEQFWRGGSGQGRKPWPDYLVFFAQLEPTLQVVLRGSGYGQCKRLFNSHWHDDRRRQGDVVVWCLDPAKQREPKTTLQGGNVGSRTVGMEEIEDAIHDPDTGTGRIGQKVLGGGAKTRKAKEDHRETDRTRTRVVEKPFWKVREPDD
ncbi:uncharacterized protein A1O5_00394 [Cladophialophora psammophila CBS 110553]|uniref:Mannosyltransferase n=1 Tax=Cladophialophora psammophila CBS 110553 TaxID=1182543 RepID=W9XG36_9EURO|nr:uncharacterized protein A1O5_00394 [Cladophialophora psammophila CBS 110553]EXJ75886.1 hypothetical protein A1O5_00394 [Cladophialophora psammophila CBS 110553]